MADAEMTLAEALSVIFCCSASYVHPCSTEGRAQRKAMEIVLREGRKIINRGAFNG